ncbi:unnamed protein product, partial [Nesidiocoris tenuis]
MEELMRLFTRMQWQIVSRYLNPTKNRQSSSTYLRGDNRSAYPPIISDHLPKLRVPKWQNQRCLWSRSMLLTIHSNSLASALVVLRGNIKETGSINNIHLFQERRTTLIDDFLPTTTLNVDVLTSTMQSDDHPTEPPQTSQVVAVSVSSSFKRQKP